MWYLWGQILIGYPVRLHLTETETLPASMRITAILLAAILSGCASTDVGTAFDDTRNESLAEQRIENIDPRLKDANVSINSFDGVVLITGQIPSADLIAAITSEVDQLRNVRKVHNELQVAGNTTLLSRTNDSWLTTKIKSKMAADETTESLRIKVVTEDSVVYLMGLLTRNEADAAVELTRSVEGVQKIVKLFEYIN